ncbi:MAG: AraC family transcriptional regulator [Cyanobacteriota bacterium]|nr:AraC family transcriptional regulator [Cyanobacteriota bacterium]
MAETSLILKLGAVSPLTNPFQGLMTSGLPNSLSAPGVESPLPLGASRNDPSLLASFSGVFQCTWPSIHLVALAGEAATTHLHGRRWLSLVFVVSGDVRILQGEACLNVAAGDCFFLPERPLHWQSSDYNVVCLMFAPEQLREHLQLLRYQYPDQKCLGTWDFSQPACCKAMDGDVEATLLSTLHHLLTITSELVQSQPILFTRLGIESQFCLLTAVLATPNFHQSLISETDAAKNGGVIDAMEELTQYIKDNLSEPLSLAILERHSHYSRRSLQYAFRERFGCTITQWIRSQRLDEARKRILSARAQESVTSIAHACGYRSVSLFSLEFQKRFHVKPSVLLRDNQGHA